MTIRYQRTLTASQVPLPEAPPMTEAEARTCVEAIKAHAGEVRRRLVELYQRQGWRALGYDSWRACAAAEFPGRQSYLYDQLQAGQTEQHLLRHGVTVAVGELPERRLRPLTPLAPEAQAQVASTVDLRHATGAQVQQAEEAYRDGTTTKSHAESWAERRAAIAHDSEQRFAGLSLDDRLDRIERADALGYLRALPDACVNLCVTSPPYWAKRTYAPGNSAEVGQEPDPQTYLEVMRRVLGQVGRVLRDDGWLFLNLGDTYASQPGQYRGNPERATGISASARSNAATAPRRRWDVPDKSLCLVPWRLVTALMLHEGWRCRNVIAWHKPNHQPENVGDRLTQAWEPVFALTRGAYPYFQRGKGEADLWTIGTGGAGGGGLGGHPAVFPAQLVHRIIAHACPAGGVVLDPFAGSGTVLRVAKSEGRRFLGCDLLADPGLGDHGEPSGAAVGGDDGDPVPA